MAIVNAQLEARRVELINEIKALQARLSEVNKMIGLIKTTPRTDLSQQLMQMLYDAGDEGLSAKDAATKGGLNPQSVAATLSRMKSTGALIKRGNAYVIPAR